MEEKFKKGEILNDVFTGIKFLLLKVSNYKLYLNPMDFPFQVSHDLLLSRFLVTETLGK